MFDDASVWEDRWLIFDDQLPKMKLQEFPVLTPPLPDSETLSVYVVYINQTNFDTTYSQWMYLHSANASLHRSFRCTWNNSHSYQKLDSVN